MKGVSVSQLLKVLAACVFVFGLGLVVFNNSTDISTLWGVLFGGLTLFTLGEVVP